MNHKKLSKCYHSFNNESMSLRALPNSTPTKFKPTEETQFTARQGWMVLSGIILFGVLLVLQIAVL